jgi:hypothetical protein
MAMNPRLMRPRASGFNPRSIAGLFAWWDFSDSATLTLSGSNITAVSDKSGNGRNAVQVSGVNQPTLATAARNGRNAADFDGVNDALDATVGATQFAAMTVFAVAIADAAGGGNEGRLFDRGSAGGRMQRNNANTALSFNPPWTGATGNAQQRSAAGSFPLSQWRLLAVRYTGGLNTATDIQPRVNAASSTASLTGTGDGFSTSQSSTLSIGNRSAADGYDRGWDGRIGELLIYAASLTDLQIAAIEGHLAKKWGF